MSDEVQKFEILGEKIKRLVDMVQSLKNENESLKSDINEARKTVESLSSEKDRFSQAENDRRLCQEELERVKRDKEEIRRKVESLLGDLEGLDLS